VTQGLEIPCSIQLSYERGWLIRLYEMVGTIGNGKIMTKPKNTSRSGLASFGPEIVVDQTRG
jgi:hypothetical protein